MKRTGFGLVISAVLTLSIAGCASGGSSTSVTSGPPAVSFPMFTDGLLTYERVEQPGGGYVSMMALFVGTLAFDNGCLLVDGDPYIFPADSTAWDGTTLTVEGMKYTVGDKIAAGGGALHDLVLPEEVRARCGDRSPVLVGGVEPEVPEPIAPADLPTDEAWAKLPTGPLSARRGSVGAWVGDKFLIVGGWSDQPCPPNADCNIAEPALRDGATYTPYSGVWQSIAPAPAPVSQYSSAVLNDDLYMLTFDVSNGGVKVGTDGRVLLSFLRYDLETNAWTTLPTPPSPGALVAVGDKMLAIPGSDENLVGVDSVFDPASQSWTALPDDPLGPSYDRQAVWLNDSVLLTAKDLVESPGAKGPSRVRLASLDSGFTSWNTLRDSEIIGIGPLAVAGRVVFPFYGSADGGDESPWTRPLAYGGIFNPADQTWTALPELPGPTPIDEYDNGHPPQAVGNQVLIGGRLLLDPVTGTVTALPAPRWSERIEATVITGPDSILVWGGATYDAAAAGANHADGYLLGL